MQKKTIFLSHASQDADAANQMVEFLEHIFSSNARVFASANWESIEMGSDWFDDIKKALDEAAIGILLATHNSLGRPWLHYEAGALRLLGKKMIPVCIGGVKKNALPSPIDRSQACVYENKEDLRNMLRSIANTLELPAHWISLEFVENSPAIVIKEAAEVEQLAQSTETTAHALQLKDRWTTIVYTCRSTFAQPPQPCPSETPLVIPNKSVSLHTPVDEIRTLGFALHQLLPVDSREEDDVLHTMFCSKEATGMIKLETGSISISQTEERHLQGPPNFMERDWLIIGENNFSNPILQMMHPFLHWQNMVTYRGARGVSNLRPDVYVELLPSWNEPVLSDQLRQVHSGGGMIALFPNPFNIRRQVLVLFGCHRDGQFTLEQWLGSDDMHEVLSELNQHCAINNGGKLAVQIVVNRESKPAALGWAGARRSGAVPNRNLHNRRFWIKSLGCYEDGDPFLPTVPNMDETSMYDLSLLIMIEKAVQQRLFEKIAPSLQDHGVHWENERCDIGFHITLFEFFTHLKPDTRTIASLDHFSLAIGEALTRSTEMPKQCRARIRQLELLPGALVSNVDFLDDDNEPTGWLADVKTWCENSVGRFLVEDHKKHGTSLLNEMNVPFPPHVTLCRFSETLDASTQVRFRSAVEVARLLQFEVFSVTSLALTVALKKPYTGAKVIQQIPLDHK